MERGTDQEREAIREQWATMERREQAATRLIEGVVLTFGGVVLSLLAAVPRACSGDGGFTPECMAVVSPTAELVLGLLGPLAVAAGLWRCWRALRT
jgi:hypothetical protein